VTDVAAPAPVAADARPLRSTLRRGGWLSTARILDQGALGLVTVLLAARVGVDAYAPVAVLLVGFAAATTLADVGVAHELLRLRHGERADRRVLRPLVVVGAAAALAGLVLVVLGDGPAATAVGLSGLLWAAAGPVYLRQAAAQVGDELRRLAVAQGAGALVLVVLVVVFARDGAALPAVVGGALLARLAVEWLLLPPAGPLLARDGTPLHPIPVFTTHLVAFGGRNVDYLVAGPLLGGAAFAQYVLAYRLANAVYAPFGAVTTRLGISELSGGGPDDADAHYRRLLGLLLVIGSVAGVATVVGSALLPAVVGDQWQGAATLMVVLAVATPWRFLEGLIGPLAYTAGRHAESVKIELARLLFVTAAVIVGARAGLFWLAVAMAGATTVTSWFGHRWIAHRTGRRLPGFVDAAVAATLVVLAGVALWAVGS
jgi:O-antigen/teichoic acid export membrane protein